MAEGICSSEGCGVTGVFRRGMCERHYRRWRRQVTELPPLPSRRKSCSYDGCDRPAWGHSWCRGHYERWKRTGSPVPAPFRTLDQRVAEDIDYEGPVPEHMLGAGRCWVWLRYTANGYGQMSIDNRKRLVHRFMYERLIEPIPRGLSLDHLCRNPPCCNPAHLEPVTLAENVRRMRRWYREPRSDADHGRDLASHPADGA